MFSFLTGWQGYLIGGALVALLAGAGTGYVVHKMDSATIAQMKLDDANAEKVALNKALSEQQAIDQSNQEAAVKEASAQTKIITQTQTITKTVTLHVHDKILCPGGITFGIVRVLYAAENGLDPATVPLASGQSDDSCAAYEPSQFTSDIAADFGAARANAEQLNSLIASITNNNATAKGN
jgi:hypothetical protein